MIDFNQIFNAVITGHIHQMVQEQITPLTDKIDEQAKVIGFLNAEIANLKAPVEVPVELSGERIDHYIGEWFSNNVSDIVDNVVDSYKFESALDQAVDGAVDNKLDVEEIADNIDLRDLARKVESEIDLDEAIRHFINYNVNVEISA